MKTDTHAKDQNDGSINATAHQHHLSEVGTCGFYVVDSHGDKRKTWGINEDVLVAKVRFLSRKVIPMLYIL